jgi:hypothetical protein
VGSVAGHVRADLERRAGHRGQGVCLSLRAAAGVGQPRLSAHRGLPWLAASSWLARVGRVTPWSGAGLSDAGAIARFGGDEGPKCRGELQSGHGIELEAPDEHAGRVGVETQFTALVCIGVEPLGPIRVEDSQQVARRCVDRTRGQRPGQLSHQGVDPARAGHAVRICRLEQTLRDSPEHRRDHVDVFACHVTREVRRGQLRRHAWLGSARVCGRLFACRGFGCGMQKLRCRQVGVGGTRRRVRRLRQERCGRRALPRAGEGAVTSVESGEQPKPGMIEGRLPPS